MWRKCLKIAAIVALLALPYAVRQIYCVMTAHPKEIIIATGPTLGQYAPLCNALRTEIQDRLQIRVEPMSTQGSLENLHLLQRGEVDFAPYQPGTAEIIEPGVKGPNPREIRFVANLYRQVAHLVVRRGVSIQTPADLRGKRINLGLKDSGDHAMSRVLLEYYGIDETEPTFTMKSYPEVIDGFKDGTLDGALITVGIDADIFKELLGSRLCEVKPLPNGEALARRKLYISPYTIPAGLYGDGVPKEDVPTVAIGAQLLTRSDVDANLTEQITKLVLDRHFIVQNNLWELYNGGEDFAQENPEFPVHRGAAHAYNPELRPVLDPNFVEAAEGARSFIVSFLIACFLSVRWFLGWCERRREHRLDQYIQRLMKIERQQIPLDSNVDPEAIGRLEGLLDEVTYLRQEALGEVTAHQLNDDRAADSFVQMCHALSNKINSKLSRQRLDGRMQQLIATCATKPDTEEQE